MNSIEEENKKTEKDFLKDVDNGIITDAYCDEETSQSEFDANEKGKPPVDLPLSS